jgi:hypothetical protein
MSQYIPLYNYYMLIKSPKGKNIYNLIYYTLIYHILYISHTYNMV